MRLIVAPNINDVDGTYERLIALHEGRDEADSAAVNARLVLLLINHIGDSEAIAEAITCAGKAS